MPFVLLVALVLNGLMATYSIGGQTVRFLLLTASFPAGFLLGRLVYLRRSHVEIVFDDDLFHVSRGHRTRVTGRWRDYHLVSLVVDQFGRTDLRLYKSIHGEHTQLPISRTDADPQLLRDRIQGLLPDGKPTGKAVNPQVAGVV